MIESLDLPGLGPSTLDAFRAQREHACRRRQARQERPQAAPENRGHHANSLESHEVKGAVLSGRRAAVYSWLRAHGPATDRQIRDGVCGEAADMNSVRPRVTELIDAGLARECGATRDQVTECTVRLVEAVAPAEG
jgi:hypothetical protein